ncbi:hypothetical protein Y032_0235g3171 [Ancylostoma ceylanicum]|uniref:Uncharacterized protein n=1 Tax=Ancylostoma ceylanicum TaxID=53326 RepID=A0A016SFH3_9BILA|nr:hypothetical protein Y032_0235g3171 [Ancylostoma ceylanicum]
MITLPRGERPQTWMVRRLREERHRLQEHDRAHALARLEAIKIERESGRSLIAVGNITAYRIFAYMTQR